MVAKKKDVEATIRNAILDHTADWVEKYFSKEEKVSEKSKQLAKFLGEMSFSKGDKEKLASILSLATGEDVVIEGEDNIEFDPLVAFVITKNTTKDATHNYEVDKVLLSIGDGTALPVEGEAGNFVPKRRAIVRPATEAEIKAITPGHIKSFQKAANILIASD